MKLFFKQFRKYSTGTFLKGKDLFLQGKYKESFEILQNEKDSESLCYLGKIYSHEKKFQKAFLKFDESQKLGNIDACTNIGFLYENGLGVEQNIQLAKDFYLKSSIQGDTRAMTYLGMIHFQEGDTSTAITFLKKASDKKNHEAMNFLGSVYEYEKNFEEAKKYYQKAIDHGSREATNNMGKLYENGIGVEQDFETAKKYYETGIERGSSESMNNLGLMYLEGRGVDVNFEQAHHLFSLGVELENPESFALLGDLYEKGLGVEENLNKAIDLYKEGIQHGDSEACNSLALLHQSQGNWQQTLHYFQMGVERNNIHSMYNLAELLEAGEICMKDVQGAFELYKTSADLGLMESQTNVGVMYENGMGVEKDKLKAIEYYKKAIKQEDTYAMVNLGILFLKDKLYDKAKELFLMAVQFGYQENDLDEYFEMIEKRK